MLAKRLHRVCLVRPDRGRGQTASEAVGARRAYTHSRRAASKLPELLARAPGLRGAEGKAMRLTGRSKH